MLSIVGLGPGSPGLLTPDAAEAIDRADTVVGYHGYLELIADRLSGKTVVGRDLGTEVERAGTALALAEAGHVVALVSSGDAGIYGMGGVAWELSAGKGSGVEIVVVPGVTAACSAAARLGAPLAHDWACISLSDLLTPWPTIVARVEASARADLVLVFYNPASRTRSWQLKAVAELLLRFREAGTPVGLVENAYRAGEVVEVIRLDDLGARTVSMFTTVIVGNSRTFEARGRMVTPRIYEAKTRSESSAESQTTPPAPGGRIMEESLAIIERELGPEPTDPDERSVVRRMVHATADFEFARSTRFGPGAIEAAVAAFGRGAAVLTDVEMLRVGVRRDLLGPIGAQAICALDEPASELLGRKAGLTRSAAGVRRLAERLGDGVVVAIGNAPTALDEALRLVEMEGWRPACLVGIPVGFVGVEAAKRRLVEQSRVPFVTSPGRKGGTAVTAAVVNALLEMAGRRKEGTR
ncbi:MAG: precorrin-3B C(17)-methyltransferase [Isosphaeraceae bacterium]